MEHKMKYKKHIIANLDILNFKQIIQQDTYNELFANLFSIVNAFSKMDTAFMHLKGIQTAVLSDSFIFSIPFSHDASFEKILSMVYVVQRILMENQILTRGAISVGQLYHADNVVFGPALVDAYLLQEYNAIYPRCIIQTETLRECMGTCASKVGRRTEMQYFFQDTDGFWVFDFFYKDLKTKMYADQKAGSDKTMKSIRLIKSFIEQNLQQKHAPRVVAKYEWLKTRLNQTLDRIQKEPDCIVALGQYAIHAPSIIDAAGTVI